LEFDSFFKLVAFEFKIFGNFEDHFLIVLTIIKGFLFCPVMEFENQFCDHIFIMLSFDVLSFNQDMILIPLQCMKFNIPAFELSITGHMFVGLVDNLSALEEFWHYINF